MVNIFIGLSCFLVAYQVYTTGAFIPYFVYGVELGILKIPFSIFMIFLGLYFIKNHKKIWFQEDTFGNIESYSICPKCEKSYLRNDLKDGICPKCDIKTIDLKGFYKKGKDKKLKK